MWSLVDKCPSFTRMVTEYHGFIFLVGRFNRFFYFLRIISVPWYSAVIRVKKLGYLCENLSTCKLTRIVTEHHGFLFLFLDSTAFLNFPKITFGPWYFAVTRVKKSSDICVKVCQLANSHGLLLSITDFIFLFVNLMAFLKYPKITFVPWYSAIIRVKKTRTSVWRSLRHGRTIFRLMCLCVRPSTCAASCVAYTSKP